jgi:hypothetical protein
VSDETPLWHKRFLSPDSRFTVEVIEELLEQLRDGKSMREICADQRMPSRETVRIWSEKGDDLALAITRAEETGWIDRAERAVEAAKKAPDASTGRLAFDAERWFLGKRSHIFRDKVTVGGDKDNPIAVKTAVSLEGAPDEVLKYLAERSLPGES